MKKAILQSGALLGFITVLYSVILYVLGPEYTVNVWQLLIMVVVMITSIFVIAFWARRAFFGGFIKFKNAFLFCMGMLFVSWLCSFAYGQVFSNFIDPGYEEKLQQASINYSVSWMESAGMSQDDIDKALNDMEENVKKERTVLDYVMGALWSIGFGALISVIVAAIIKKKNPAELAANSNPVDQV